MIGVFIISLFSVLGDAIDNTATVQLRTFTGWAFGPQLDITEAPVNGNCCFAELESREL